MLQRPLTEAVTLSNRAGTKAWRKCSRAFCFSPDETGCRQGAKTISSRDRYPGLAAEYQFLQPMGPDPDDFGRPEKEKLRNSKDTSPPATYLSAAICARCLSRTAYRS